RFPKKGTIELNEHDDRTTDGVYLLSASYTDRGANGIASLTSRDFIALRHPVLQAEDFDEGDVSVATLTTAFMAYVNGVRPGGYMRFKDIDLTNVARVGLRIQPNGAGGVIEIRQGGKQGELVGKVPVPAGRYSGPSDGWSEFKVDIKGAGAQDLYLVF